MTFNYYKMLQISETATDKEITEAYLSQIEKWKQLQAQQTTSVAKERSDKIIARLELAYRVLSDPKARTNYDKDLNNSLTDATTMSNQSSSKALLYTLLIIILILLITMVAGIFYIIFKPKEILVPQTATQQAAANNQTTANSDEFKKALAAADQLKKQNANNPELKQIAKGIAEKANQNINTIINYNSQFLGAFASNQNITFRFMVIDGITTTPSILSAYLTERFIVNNNDVCNHEQTNLTKGTLFTFAYYNTKGNLLGSYYIDQQVCQSPTSQRILKRPDENQLKSLEINSDGTVTPTTSDQPNATEATTDHQ